MLSWKSWVVTVVALGLNHGEAGATSLKSTGATVEINDIPYYIPPFSVGSLQINIQSPNVGSVNGFVPMTVIDSSVGFEQLIHNFSTTDDVFNSGFLQVVNSPDCSEVDGSTLKEQITISCTNGNSTTTVPRGPYFWSQTTHQVHQAYRLYSDFAGAFTESVIRTPQGTYIPLPASIAGSSSLTIGVPSRLYYESTTQQPLAGVRIGVKDIYDLAGIRTSDGNRAYYNLYPPKNASATPVQRLEDAGAIVVGKQKTSQFANGEVATADWVDYHSPFNPRGDGYQDPSSSSAGAGASIGSYPWLDIALGSDTGGSIRGPSQSQGLFGNRPTHGLVSLDGVMPLSPILDTAGFLTRSPELWGRAQGVLYGNISSVSAYPKKIYTTNFPTNVTSPSDAIFLTFLSRLQTFLGTNSTALDLNAAWAATGPSNVSSLAALLNITYPILISKDQTRLVRGPFYADYAAAHDGRLPFVDPAPLVRWAFGDAYPDSVVDQALSNRTLFANWFKSQIVKNVPKTCSDSLLVYPGSDATATSERNVYRKAPAVPYGFGTSRISPLSGAPDSVFPIGEATFFSPITNHDEYLPVTVDIVAAPGCDGMIVQLAQDLEKAGILNSIQAGQTIDGGDILFRRELDFGRGLASSNGKQRSHVRH